MVQCTEHGFGNDAPGCLDWAGDGSIPAQGEMSARSVVVGSVLVQDLLKVLLAEWDDMIGALSPN